MGNKFLIFVLFIYFILILPNTAALCLLFATFFFNMEKIFLRLAHRIHKFYLKTSLVNYLIWESKEKTIRGQKY